MQTSTFIALSALLIPSAAADVITWGSVEDITTSSEVSTNGTLVTARNPWAQTFSSPTVNGVLFDAWTPPEWGNGGWTLLDGSTTGDSEYDSLLDSARVPTGGAAMNPTGQGGIRIDTIAALNVGTVYQIQVWYSDQRTGTASNVLNDRVMHLSSATGVATTNGGMITNLGSLTQGPVSAGLEADPNNTAGGGDTIFGSYCIGSFTRTTNDPLWLLVEGVHPIPTNVLRPHINAFQIREISGSGLGTNYCGPANANSTGVAGEMSATGSNIAADNDFTVVGSNLPTGQFSYFIASRTQGFVAGPGGSQGNLCVLGSIARFNRAGEIGAITGGQFQLQLPLVDFPEPTGSVAVMAGDTWNFQCWHRDSSPTGPTSNFTDGLSVLFQ
ncbi:MAG: hypothetical protein ACI8QC_003899 [Planctomycetota bacterium]|jgi:hypothetical protein